MVYKRVPTQILVAAFETEHGAETAVQSLLEAMSDEHIVCTNLAIAKKGKHGQIRVKEYGNPTLLKGMTAGGAAGAVIGSMVGGISLAFLGPIGVATGAVAGGVVAAPIGAVNGAALGTYAQLTVKGMEKDKLKTLGSALESGTSALVAFFAEVVIDESDFDKVALKEVKEDTDDFVKSLGDDIGENLRKGNQVAYLLAVDEDGVVASKMTEGEDAVNFKAMILTTDAAKVGEVTVTAEGAAIQATKVTESGVATGAAVMTDDAVVYEVAAVKGDEGYHEVGAVAVAEE